MAHPHWSLFAVIDEDLHTLSRYIEFTEANYRTYSVELLRLYLSICSEVDVIGKLLCTRTGVALRDRPNMDDYRKALNPKYPNLAGLKITIRPVALSIVPWAAWHQNANPEWWQKHQLVKHRRDQHFPDANLANVLEAAAGLLVFLVYWHQPEIYNVTVSAFFRMFEIEGIRAGIDWVGKISLKDFGQVESTL
jgi:hypothetical protein